MIGDDRDLAREEGRQLRGNWAALAAALDQRGDLLATKLDHLRSALSAIASAFAEQRAAAIAHSKNESTY